MEIKLGSYVETKIERVVTEFIDTKIFLRKGLRGWVCDTDNIKDGWVFVEFNDPEILENGTGVYAYDVDELTVIKY